MHVVGSEDYICCRHRVQCPLEVYMFPQEHYSVSVNIVKGAPLTIYTHT